MSHTHKFAPTKPQQQKISLECSLPQAVTCIEKVTTALPFPNDISKALDYSSAYIDHAAHLAKHALHQFDHLQKAHSDLHAVVETRNKKIAALECDNRTLEQKNRGLQSKYAELEKHHARDVQAAKVRETQLKKQLADALEALAASQHKVGHLEQYIDQDKLDDIKRNQNYDKHISADHLRIRQSEERLAKAEAEIVELKANIEATNKKLAVADATIKTLQEQLSASEAKRENLSKDLETEKQAKLKLKADLDSANEKLDKATIKIGRLESENAAKDALMKSKDETIKSKDDEVDALQRSWDDVSGRLTKKAAEVNKNEEIYKNELKLKQDVIDRLSAQPKANNESLLKSNITSDVVEISAGVL